MKFHPSLEKWRDRTGHHATRPGEEIGAFLIPGPCGQDLRVIASSGDVTVGVMWEHASVSLRNRTPNWQEMCFIKDLFWDEEDTVMQLHPPKSKWINIHPNVLHLWRPWREAIPLPPEIAV